MKFMFILFSVLITPLMALSQAYPIAKNSAIKKYELNPGEQVAELAMDNGKKWKVGLSVPELREGEKVPLVLALHWAGEGDQFKRYTECLAYPALKNYRAIIVAPSAEGGHWIDFNNEIRVIKLVEQILKYWPVDPNKVLITGYSNGAIGTWFYCHNYAELFTAGLPISGFYDAANMEVPMYVLHGSADELFSPAKVESEMKRSRQAGSDIQFKLLDGYSHHDACRYVAEMKAAFKVIKAKHLE